VFFDGKWTKNERFWTKNERKRRKNKAFLTKNERKKKVILEKKSRHFNKKISRKTLIFPNFPIKNTDFPHQKPHFSYQKHHFSYQKHPIFLSKTPKKALNRPPNLQIWRKFPRILA
jgi:hypothetical protein